MEKRPLALSSFRLALVCALFLSACGGKGNSGGTGTVTSVSITPTSVTVPLNTTTEFTASVTLSSSSSTSTSTSVTWEVNGTAGGSSTLGTIVASPTNVQVGIYTAPSVAPGVNNNVVNITAVAPEFPGSTTDTATVTSNTATVTIGSGAGLAITQLTSTVPAGGTHQFTATLNGLNDPNATWSVTQVAGANVGSINPVSGLYTAPPFPPPGASVTITATDPAAAAPATATVQITYSDLSFKGPFAFSYSGNDSSGFLAAAGSFVTDGQGNIVSGIEDLDSFSNGTSLELPFTGTYVVGADGRGSASISTGRGTTTWEFALTTNKHALMTRFDAKATGGGTIDQQNLNDLSTSTSILSGPYVFRAAGTDSSFRPMGMAGEFSADGSGNIPQSATILDVNDNGTLASGASGDTTLHGSYQFDASNAGTGRGILTLTSNTTGTLQFAFYVTDSAHLYFIENDNKDFLVGNLFAGAGPGVALASGGYSFTAGGTTTSGTLGAFATGGVLTANGAGGITAGTLDTNAPGKVTTNATLASCSYTTDPVSGRIALTISSGTCAASPNFAAYQAADGSAVMVELDSVADSTGRMFLQNLTSGTTFTGNFVIGVFGHGAFHGSSGLVQPDVTGQLVLSGSAGPTGTLDINNFSAVFKGDSIVQSGSSIAAASNGRATLVIEGSDPGVTYNLVYYVIGPNSALIFDQDANSVGTGALANQF